MTRKHDLAHREEYFEKTRLKKIWNFQPSASGWVWTSANVIGIGGVGGAENYSQNACRRSRVSILTENLRVAERKKVSIITDPKTFDHVDLQGA